MRKKRFLIPLLIVSLAGLVIGHVLSDPVKFGTCNEKYVYAIGEEGSVTNPPGIGCMDPKIQGIGQPLFLASLSLLISIIILFIAPERVLKYWGYFAVVAIPLGFLLIATTPVQCGGALDLCFDRKLTTFFVSGAYLIISFLILVIKSILLKRTKNNPSPSDKQQ